MSDINLKGFVIVPPINTWDEKNKDLIIGTISYHTLGRTSTEAWCRFLSTNRNDIDFSIKVQRCFDKGYRLKEASLTIKD